MAGYNPNTYGWHQCDEENYNSNDSLAEQAEAAVARKQYAAELIAAMRATVATVPSYCERKPDTMTVTVMYRNNWFGGDGWTYYPKTVTISAYCPKCGAHRGEPYWTNQPEDGEWFQLNRWDNPCGHLDTYHEALIEAQEQEQVAKI